MTACWNEDDNLIKRSKGLREETLATLEQVGIELDGIGKSTIGTRASGFRNYLALLERRRKLVAQLDMLEDAFPPEDRTIEGPNNITILREGVIAVKRLRGRQEAYHWVGTFMFQDISMIPATSTTPPI